MILIFILISSITLIIDNPLTNPESKLLFIIDKIDIVLTGIFIIEFLLKTIAHGFAFNGPNSYIRNSWNVLDFVIVLSAVTFIILIFRVFL